MDPKLEPGGLVAGFYRLERALGEGGMGVVWAATHELTRRRVALKLVKRADAPTQRARLLREARASCAVRHPHVREVYDIVEDDGGSPVMIMEYLAGESLADKLEREGILALPEASALLLPVVSAVGAAHALGIIHRDLKPGNIFLSEGPPPMVKVLDFGIAKLTASEGEAAATAGLTASGALLGTPRYMSPEQAFGERDVDHRMDVWALGLILYRCLSGTLPTEADNVGQVFKNIVAKPIQSLEQIAPELPADVVVLVGRMLSRARRDRPGDLREVAALLARYTDTTAPDFGAPLVSATPGSLAGAQLTELAALVDPLAEAEDRLVDVAHALGPSAPSIVVDELTADLPHARVELVEGPVGLSLLGERDVPERSSRDIVTVPSPASLPVPPSSHGAVEAPRRSLAGHKAKQGRTMRVTPRIVVASLLLASLVGAVAWAGPWARPSVVAPAVVAPAVVAPAVVAPAPLAA